MGVAIETEVRVLGLLSWRPETEKQEELLTMMCCHACPFHPITDSADPCLSPRCSSKPESCHRECRPEVRYRCHQDEYVIRGLPTMDPLAVMLAPFSLDTACEGRDRLLLVDLFRGASEGLRGRLWRRLGEHRERALWLINPLLEAAGLARVEEWDSPGELYPTGDGHRSMNALARQESPVYGVVVSPVTVCGQAAAYFRELEQDTERTTSERPLADGVRLATDQAFSRLRLAVTSRDADSLCDLFLDVPAMLRSSLWRYLLLFHADDLDLLNPLFERNELPPLERGASPIELGDYRQALWNE